MRINDAFIGLALIAFAIVAGLATRGFPVIPGQQYGARLFPQILCVGFALCGLLLIRSGWRSRASRPLLELEPWARSVHGVGSIVLVVGGLVFYVLASDWLGFIPTAFAIVAALLVWLRGRAVSSLVIAAVATIAVHQMFYKLLLVPLPWGVLEPIVF